MKKAWERGYITEHILIVNIFSEVAIMSYSGVVLPCKWLWSCDHGDHGDHVVMCKINGCIEWVFPGFEETLYPHYDSQLPDVT